MALRAAVALAVLVHAVPTPAQFEGVADVKMTGEGVNEQMTGKGRLYLSKVAWRMELATVLPGKSQGPTGAKAPAEDFRLVTFGKASEPRKSWMLNERTKTYAVIEEDEGRAGGGSPDDWTVTKLGQDQVAGFPCTNVKAQHADGEQIWEGCLAKDFISGAWLKSADTEDGWWTIVAKRVGVTGYPVRMIARRPDGTEKHRFEIVKVERKKVPASLFEVPAGYRQGTMMDVLPQSPEQQRELQEAQKRAAEAMKDMSPEQKKMLEDMMKGLQGGEKK